LDGEAIPYRRLLLATGARPRPLPLPGADGPTVATLRTLDEAARIRAALGLGRHLVVIGDGFIGLELATSDPDIFAAGDCCSFPQPFYGGRRVRLECWRSAQEQGTLAARNMLGAAEPVSGGLEGLNRLGGDISSRTSDAPSWAKRCATARPIPIAAPVTNTRFGCAVVMRVSPAGGGYVILP
jgi:NADPH-dependent 2,4-dienoyl-CoA reductase/sulfur reductase-like enzyme